MQSLLLPAAHSAAATKQPPSHLLRPTLSLYTPPNSLSHPLKTHFPSLPPLKLNPTKPICASAQFSPTTYTSPNEEPDKTKLAQVSKRLDSTSRYFKMLGNWGFWGQLVCTIIAAVIISFSVVATGKVTSPISFYSTAGGIAAAFVSVFWSFGYLRIAEKLKKAVKEPSKAPPRADVVKSLKNGITPIGTCGQSMPKAYPDSDVGSVQQLCYKNSSDAGKAIDEAYRNTAQRFSLTPYITPRLTPTGTPTVSSTCESPRGYSAAESPRLTSGTASPTFSSYDGKSTMSSWYSSSQQSSAANSPPRGRSLPARAQRIDGKEFFRQARNRLSYEQFSGFLANIKELNAQKQTREETLRKAEEIFGTDNKDLYISFQALLNRSIR